MVALSAGTCMIQSAAAGQDLVSLGLQRRLLLPNRLFLGLHINLSQCC